MRCVLWQLSSLEVLSASRRQGDGALIAGLHCVAPQQMDCNYGHLESNELVRCPLSQLQLCVSGCEVLRGLPGEGGVFRLQTPLDEVTASSARLRSLAPVRGEVM